MFRYSLSESAFYHHSVTDIALETFQNNRMHQLSTALKYQQGDEISINYLGRGSLKPVELRLEALADGYGFDCNCERCLLEIQHYNISEWIQVSEWALTLGKACLFRDRFCQPKL